MAKTKLEVESDFGPVVNTFNAINKEIDVTEENILGLGKNSKAAFDQMTNAAKSYGKGVSGNVQDLTRLRQATKDQVQTIQQLTAARKASNDPAQIAAYNQKINEARQKIKAMHQDQAKAAKENQEGTKKQIGLINQLLDKQRKLTEARDKSNDPALIRRYNGLIDETKNKLNDLTNTQQKLAAKSSGGGLFGAILGGNLAFAAIQKVRQGISDAFNVQVNFQKSLQNLSAITGASGKDLVFYGQQAIEMGRRIEGGATAAVEAFKLIGSAKPELLQNKEALVEVTEAAITLSQASGLTLPEAAENLGTALNAFNAPAKDAGKFINVMAAAAQLGAKEIPFVTFALSKFGGVAKSANVSIEESAAAIELLGAKIPQAEAVGTNLRNILIILQTEASKQGRAFLGLRGELDLLAPKIKDVAFLEKTFGRDNLLATQGLIQQREELSKLAEEVTGTNSAFEQARTNTNTLDQSVTELTNSWDGFLLSLSKSSLVQNKVNGFIKGTTALLTGLSQVISGTYFDAQNRMNRQLGALTDEFVNGKISATEYGNSLRAILFLNRNLAKSAEEAAKAQEEAAEASIGVIGRLKKEIADLNESLDFAKAEDVSGIIATIKQKQKELDRLLGKATEDTKKAKDEFERAILDLRKRVAQAQIDAAGGEERIALEMKFQQEELQITKDHFIKMGQALNKNFKLTLVQQEQFEILRQQIIKKAADATIQLEIDRQARLAAQINKGNEQTLQALANEENAAINGVNGLSAPKGIDEGTFETQKQTKLLDIQASFAQRRFELQKKSLADQRNLEVQNLDLQLQAIGNGDDKATAEKRASIMRDVALLEERYQIEGEALQIQIDALIGDINSKKDALNKAKPFSLADLFGLTEEELQIMKTALNEISNLIASSFNLQLELVNQQISLSQQRINQYQNEIDTLEGKVTREMELNNEGKANNLDRLNAEIAAKEQAKIKEQKIEADALEKRKQLQKQQLNLDTALQASNLITASTEIFAATANAGPVGVAAAIVAIGAMITAFAATKIKAYEAINSQDQAQGFKEGVVGLEGPGTSTSDSISARLSAGESVMTAKETKQNKRLLLGIHHDDERMMKAGVLDLIKNTGIRLSDDLPEMITAKKEIIKQNEIKAYLKTDNSRLEKEVQEMKGILTEILKENKEKVYTDPNGSLVIKKGTHKEIIRKK
jgi:TP901 family phage tail tape measure protein